MDLQGRLEQVQEQLNSLSQDEQRLVQTLDRLRSTQLQLIGQASLLEQLIGEQDEPAEVEEN